MDTRAEILELAKRFWREKPKNEFIPGETYIPVTGKVLDGEDLTHLMDASLDLWLTTGRYAEQFEKNLAKFIGVGGSRLTCSGSSANLLAFSALTSNKLKKPILPGSEIITTAAGFPTTVTPILQNGCVPVFVDVDLETHNIDVSKIEAAITPKTAGIMAAHALGNPFRADLVQAIAKKHQLYFIEDCCDALGATLNGKMVGTFGDLGTLSFYPAHHITMGEGGAVFGTNPQYLRLVESFRDWGRDCWCKTGHDNTCKQRFDWKLGDLPQGYDHKYIYSHLGYNLKVTDMQAALGCSQLVKAPDFIERRRENFNKIKAGFLAEGLDRYFTLPTPTPGSNPSWFGFLLTLRDDVKLSRRDLVHALEELKIGTRLLFGGNLTKQPAFKGQNFRISGELTHCDTLMERSFWIGVWPGITDRHIQYMVSTFKKIMKERLS